jgi:hypothetical protein
VVVCGVTDCARELAEDLDDLVAAVASSESSVSRDDVVALELVRVLDAAVCALVATPSCQASTPPSESIEATLSAAAALRARAARGRRRGRGVGVGSSMTTKVRTSGEGPARAG